MPLREGTYQVRVTVKNGVATTRTRQAVATFTIRSRVSGGRAVVSATANPLVALYSVPPCATGTVVVMYRPATGPGEWRSMAPQACQAGHSLNVLVAGMRPKTQFLLRHVLSSGVHVTTSAALPFTTGALPSDLKVAPAAVVQGAKAQSDDTAPLLFHALAPQASANVVNPLATDRSGQLTWYYDTLHSGLTTIWPLQIVPGGTILLVGQDRSGQSAENVLREINLAGITVRETNIAALNAQLTRRHQQIVYGFAHDALRLPNGDTAVIGLTQETAGGRDLLGDMILVLDTNWQVAWVWDPFDHLDTSRHIGTGETCDVTYPPGLCPIPDKHAEDWLHTNAIGYSPSDGNLILSMRYQNWVVKIDYRNGHGSGKVVWRLGQGGDFTLQATGASPWFSYQHDVRYVDDTHLILFDNGNLRCNNGLKAGCHSRGQEWQLDETHHIARLVANVDLGVFASGLGSAEVLPNGDLTFGAGLPHGRSIEFGSGGHVLLEQDTLEHEYRIYRVASLDSSPYFAT
jgi:hypothetical protein